MQARALAEARVEADRMLLATQSALDADGDLLSDDERTHIDAASCRPLRLQACAVADAPALEAATQALAKGTEAFAAAAHEPRHPQGPGGPECADPVNLLRLIVPRAMPVIKILPHAELLPPGRRNHRAGRNLHLRGLARQPHRH
jgi:hypothetical protein